MKRIVLLLALLVFPACVFAYTNEKSAKIKLTDNEKNINEYFNLEKTNRSWSVEDASVASVVDGTIIPIKVGSTVIKATIGSDTYILNLEVTNEEVAVVTTNKDINSVMKDVNVSNPKTGDEIVLLGLVIILSLLTIIFFKTKMNHGRYEEE